MLYDPARHERLTSAEWDETAALRTIERIVRDAEERYALEGLWRMHPLDADGGDTRPAFNLYFGAGGVIWALHYLQAMGAVTLHRSYREDADALLAPNREWLSANGCSQADHASYLMGDTSLAMLAYWLSRSDENAARLEHLIAGNVDHPARELMWGSPGTMLAALLLHRWTRERRWADLFVATARKLRSQLLWSDEFRCHYWTQDLYGHRSTYLDAVHGFVATAMVLINGRDLLDAGEWEEWERCIVTTIRATVLREGREANWPAYFRPMGQKRLLQFCHGAPGFVVCLAHLPAAALDDDLLAAGEATWNAGPLAKGSNLCHGTGGNGYALLKLYERTGDERWLARARAFAMHGIAQTDAHAARYGQMRYSLWTGDPGFAIYLWDCIRGTARFPTLDTFFV